MSLFYVAPWWKALLIKLFYNRHHPLVVVGLLVFMLPNTLKVFDYSIAVN